MGKEVTQFKKGNPGKPKGAKNKVTNEIREKFERLLETVSVEQLAEDLQQLKPVERLNVIMGLAEYITPKLARTHQQHDVSEGITGFTLEVIRNKNDKPDFTAA